MMKDQQVDQVNKMSIRKLEQYRENSPRSSRDIDAYGMNKASPLRPTTST